MAHHPDPLLPPFIYAGSRVHSAEQIVSVLPPHKHYVEPFAGSLSVLLRKTRAPMETVNDLDGLLMAFWRVLRDRYDELEVVCALTPTSRAEYQACQDTLHESGIDELERARRVWVVFSQGRAGTLRNTGWRHFAKGGAASGIPERVSSYLGRFAPVAERLRNVSLECKPALELIGAYGAHAENLLYCDPPFLRERGSSPLYAHEMQHPIEHEQLAAALRECNATVVLSGYASDLYDGLYDGWHRHAIDPEGAPGASSRPEMLWSNRPWPGTLDLCW